MGIWKTTSSGDKDSEDRIFEAVQLPEEEFEVIFCRAREYKAKRVERRPERLTLGHAELRCGNAEADVEAQFQRDQSRFFQ